jgi:putative transposase
VGIGGENSHFQTILGQIINAYKGAVTASIRKQRSTDEIVWQERYHDHVIRDEIGLCQIRSYIENNPVWWAEDTLYTEE